MTMDELERWIREKVDEYPPTMGKGAVEHLLSLLDRERFIVDYLYEALGAANDDILAMAEEAWEETRKDGSTP